MSNDSVQPVIPDTSFVGRERELGELRAAFDRAVEGKGSLAMLVGEPGIGKTRTSQELTAYAEERGAQVLLGRCHEQAGMPPYWPWVQPVRTSIQQKTPEMLRREMGAGAADIAELIPEVHGKLPNLEPAPALEDLEQARFRLFDSITTFLKASAEHQPVVLVLDNLHWADRPSLLLLEFLAQELAGSRLLVVGTYRDVELSRRHPLAETLGELTKERLFQRILLRGLSEEDVRRFVETTAGLTPSQSLVDAVYTQTEGNPLFVTEVVRGLVEEGELTADDPGRELPSIVRIPEGVREAIGRRLNRLTERCSETLTIASVIGREFELRQLQLLISSASSGQALSEDQLLEVLEEAVGARIIDELPQAVGRYQFTHALVRGYPGR